MPEKVVWREVEELSGITLAEYLRAIKDINGQPEDQV